jgi:hypothetical protein
MILEGVEKRPIASVDTVRKAARRGDLRYALIGGNCGLEGSFSHCTRALRWIRAHSVDVTRAAGLGDGGFLFELRPHGLTRSQHGRRRR